MNGVLGLFASSGLIAITVPLHQPPWIMKTWSCEISFFVAAIVLFGSHASSSITSSIFRPLMPPASLTLL